MTKRAQLVQRTVSAANRHVQLELPFDGRRQYTATPTNARPVTVVSVERITAHVQMHAERGSTHSKAGIFYRVWVNNEYEGRFDREGPMLWCTAPFDVQGIRLTLSDGQVATVYSQTLSVIKQFRSRTKRNGSFGLCPEKELVLAASVDLRIGTLGWTDARTAARGDAITHEFPFQWAGGRMTNGVVSLPPTCPSGKQWSLYPFKAVPAKRWQDFLEALKGHYHEEIDAIREALVHRRARSASAA